MKSANRFLSKNVSRWIYEGFFVFKIMAQKIKWLELNAESLNLVALLYARMRNLRNEEDFYADVPLFIGESSDWVDSMVEDFYVDFI